MKNFISTSCLLVAFAGLGVLSMGFGSCDGSSSPVAEPPIDGGHDTGSLREASAPDTSEAFEAGPSDATAPDGGEDAVSCGVPHTTLGTTCDECVATNCEPTWCACLEDASDAGGAGEAGAGCPGYVQCVEGCVATDAGSPTDCLATICAVAPFTMAQEVVGHSLLDCLVQYCATPCGQ